MACTVLLRSAMAEPGLPNGSETRHAISQESGARWGVGVLLVVAAAIAVAAAYLWLPLACLCALAIAVGASACVQALVWRSRLIESRAQEAERSEERRVG